MNDVIDMRSRQKREDLTDKNMILLMNGIKTSNSEYANMIEKIAPDMKPGDKSIIMEVLVGLQQSVTFAQAYLALNEEERQTVLQAARGSLS